MLKKNAPKLAGLAAWAAQKALGGSINIATGATLNSLIDNMTSFTSIGGILAYVCDSADRNLDGHICIG